jgi:hypothetical protein
MALTRIHKSEGVAKASNGPKQNYSKMNGKTPMPAGKPKGGKALAANPNLKGGSGSY